MKNALALILTLSSGPAFAETYACQESHPQSYPLVIELRTSGDSIGLKGPEKIQGSYAKIPSSNPKEVVYRGKKGTVRLEVDLDNGGMEGSIRVDVLSKDFFCRMM